MTDEQFALLWQAEFPNSRTRYTMKSFRTVRNLFNLGRRNNDRPRTPIPQVRSRWESRAGPAVLLTPWMATPHRNDRPVGSATIHASIAHEIEYDDAVLPASARKNRASRPTPGVHTERYASVRSRETSSSYKNH